jgi:hypothetical protein
MKTLKRTNQKGEVEYKRIEDSLAENLTRVGWTYCPKNEWKTNVRDFGKPKDEVPKRTKDNKKSQKAA